MKKIVLTGGGTLGHVTPHLALIPRLQEKGYEILYFTDSIDEFMIKMMMNYDEKMFRSVTEANLDLDSEDEKKAREATALENKDLLEAMKNALGSKITDVRISSRLSEDPVCLVADQGMSIEMEKVLNSMHVLKQLKKL